VLLERARAPASSEPLDGGLKEGGNFVARFHFENTGEFDVVWGLDALNDLGQSLNCRLTISNIRGSDNKAAFFAAERPDDGPQFVAAGARVPGVATSVIVGVVGKNGPIAVEIAYYNEAEILQILPYGSKSFGHGLRVGQDGDFGRPT